MDAVSDPAAHTVVVQSSAQVGKTEILLNIVGFHIAHDPSPILMIQPTLEMSEAFSKDRLMPMLRDTPTLSDKVADPRSRDSGNTLLHKQFPGGHITMAGANSPSSLASRPIRVVLCDEVDRYPVSAGAEGDPVALAAARSKRFWNRKLVLTSTPTIKGASRIEQAWHESDQRHFVVPCPHCDEAQALKWGQVSWDDDRPETARYACEACGAVWGDAERLHAVSCGTWRAQAEFNGVAGFHINELYVGKLADLVAGYIDAKRSRAAERMRAWVNTTLGETFEDEGDHPDEGSLQARKEVWDGVPDGVLLTTCGVDTQDNRLEYELVGWGADEESWSLEYGTIWGDPATPKVWADLDRYLLDKKPAVTCIDSGGHHTQAVYAFCQQRFRRRVYAVKGMAGFGRMVWPKRASRIKKGGQLFIVGVDSAKDSIYARLKLTTAGPGYCHFPKDRGDEWFRGLTSESVIVKYSKGFPVRVYQHRDGYPNEPLDCRVYAYAGLCSLNIRNWGALARKRADSRAKPAEPIQKPVEAPESAPIQRPIPRARRNWVTGFRNF
jgi:phage terminase large subunit GpA-like protein